MTGGARIFEQELQHGTTELNHSLLTLGVMTLVLPAVFFAALDRGSLSDLTQFALRLTPASESTGAEGASTTTSAVGEAATAAAEHAVRALAALVRRSEGEGSAEEETPEQFIQGRFEFAALLTDQRRGHFLTFSHALAILLLGCYICSRVYLHNPPGEGNALQMNKNASAHIKEKAREKENKDPMVGPYVGAIAIAVCVALMAVTAEWVRPRAPSPRIAR